MKDSLFLKKYDNKISFSFEEIKEIYDARLEKATYFYLDQFKIKGDFKRQKEYRVFSIDERYFYFGCVYDYPASFCPNLKKVFFSVEIKELVKKETENGVYFEVVEKI